VRNDVNVAKSLQSGEPLESRLRSGMGVKSSLSMNRLYGADV
jgi:hypothetical protein